MRELEEERLENENACWCLMGFREGPRDIEWMHDIWGSTMTFSLPFGINDGNCGN